MSDEQPTPIRVQAVGKGFYGKGPLGRRIVPGTVFYIENESEFSDFHRKGVNVNGRPLKPGWMIKVGDDVVSTRPDNGPPRPGLPVRTTPPGGTTMVDPLKPEPKEMKPLPSPPPAAPEAPAPPAAPAEPKKPATLASEPAAKAKPSTPPVQSKKTGPPKKKT